MSGDWTYTNWYATRLHLLDEPRTRGDGASARWALCGVAIYPLDAHAERRRIRGRSAKDYARIPHCKRCARKASKP